MTSSPSARVRFLTSPLALCLILLAGVCLWCYWTTLGEMVWRWNTDPQYSHGYLVPLFAASLLWMRRGHLTNANWRPSVWGLPVLVAAMALRLAGTRFHFAFLDQVSLLPTFTAIFLLAGGWGALRWSWPALGFLAFMVPLPETIALALSGPMQTFATNASTYFLQVLGRPALAEGNVILLNEVELGIVEACSGLRMLVVFFALSTALALVIRKPLWERLFVAASALPIALVANVLRITITGLFFDAVDAKWAHAIFHDVAGWLMMPVALAFLGLEMYILKHLLIEGPTAPALVVNVATPRGETQPGAAYRNQPQPRRERRGVTLSSTTTS